MDLFERFDVVIDSKYLDRAYNLALSEKELPQWLRPEFLRELKNDWNILDKNIDTAIAALEQVVKNEDLILLAKVLYHILKLQGNNYQKAFKDIKLPSIPGDDISNMGINCVSLFPLVAFARKACEFLVEHGVEKDMAKLSMRGIDGSFSAATVRKGYTTFNPYFTWALYYVDARMVRLDDFEFQVVPNCEHPIRVYKNKNGELMTFMDGVKIHKSGFLLNSAGCDDEEGSFDAKVTETADFYEGYLVNDQTHLVESKPAKLSKSEWSEVAKPGDACIEMHIPRGSKLDDDTCQKNFNRARELFSQIFPEYDFKIFTINTWLHAPELERLLKPESNILGFQKMFKTYPVDGKGLEVFNFVFSRMYESIDEVDVDSLGEDTSLMRGIKALYKNGGFIHEYGGYFLF